MSAQIVSIAGHRFAGYARRYTQKSTLNQLDKEYSMFQSNIGKELYHEKVSYCLHDDYYCCRVFARQKGTV